MPFWYDSTPSATISAPSVNPCSVGINAETPITNTTFTSGLSVGLVPYETTIKPDDSNLNIACPGLITLTGTNANQQAYLQLNTDVIIFYDTETKAQYETITYFKGSVELDYIGKMNGNAVATSGTGQNLTIQAGQATIGGGGSVSITLPQDFKDTSYSVSITHMSSAPTSIPWAKITSTASFDISGDANAVVSWIAVGNTGV